MRSGASDSRLSRTRLWLYQALLVGGEAARVAIIPGVSYAM